MASTISHPGRVDLRLAALAEPTRLRLIEHLATGEQCVCDLQSALGAAQSRLSFHLGKLKEAGLVRSRRSGRWIYYDLDPDVLVDLGGWIGSLGADRLRAAEYGDLEAASRLLDASGLPTEGLDALLEGTSGCAWVAGEGSSLSGLVGLETHGDDGLLRSVAVVADRRGRGLGRRLVGRALREARCLDQKRVYLLTTTAEPWFRSLGFEVISRAALPGPLQECDEVRSLCPDSAVVMRRDPHHLIAEVL